MNPFNVQKTFNAPLRTGPRDATQAEVFAYMDWQREKRGLADLEAGELQYFQSREGRRYSQGHCVGRTYGENTWDNETRRYHYENGSYSLLMPGYAAHRATVTMETLNDAGEVVASQTLPAEPKKGGIVWTKETVRAACGPVAKVKAKAKRAPIAEPAGKAKRTAAHERAIRMAWAQRKAKRDLAKHYRIGQAQFDGLKAERDELAQQVQSAKALPDYAPLANRALYELERIKAKRRRSTLLGRKIQNRLSAEYHFIDKMRAGHREFEARLIAERDEAREWAALLEEENAALTRKPPALRLVA